jgi:hypothetical protein
MNWKKLIALEITVLTVLVFWLGSIQPAKFQPNKVWTAETDVTNFYQAANSAYFGDRLPKDTVLDWSETRLTYMATTVYSDSKFHIMFNPTYIASTRYIHLTEYHEMCHIETWTEQPDTHGPRWRTCMLRLDMSGAFRREIIDGHNE